MEVDRAEVISQLKQVGVSASVHWMPLHMHPYYRENFGYTPGDCPCAASIYPELISLPLYPDLTATDVEYVCRHLKEIISRARVAVPGMNIPEAVEREIVLAK